MKISFVEGRKRPWRLDARVGGRRERRFFATEKEAEAEARTLGRERQDGGTAGERLSGAERVELAGLRDAVEAAGGTMREAVGFWLAHGAPAREPMRLDELLDAAVAGKDREGKSRRYLDQLRSSVGQFCRWQGMGGRWAHEVTRGDVERWVEGKGWAAKTRRNYVVDLRTVFAWGKRSGALRWDPTEGMALPSGSGAGAGEGVAVLSPRDAGRLVARCLGARWREEGHGPMLPYVVLGLWAGLRPERELGELRLGQIHLEEGAVVVEGRHAKSRSRRVVDLSANAVALLEAGLPMLVEYWESGRGGRGIPGRREDYGLCPRNFRRRWERLRRDCGWGAGSRAGRVWPHDVMRHSFASYHYAAHQDEALLRAQMGHAERGEVLFQHYRLRVTRREAARFWGIGS